MSGVKRGPYFKYLRCIENEPQAKVPRQTIWNQKNKVFECTDFIFKVIWQIALVKGFGLNINSYLLTLYRSDSGTQNDFQMNKNRRIAYN